MRFQWLNLDTLVPTVMTCWRLGDEPGNLRISVKSGSAKVRAFSRERKPQSRLESANRGAFLALLMSQLLPRRPGAQAEPERKVDETDTYNPRQ